MTGYEFEDRFAGSVCGLDEAGRGPLAGPVVAGCVMIPPSVRSMDFMAAVTDSKKLSRKKLAELSLLIRQHCIYAIAQVSPQDIDRLNILRASLYAMEIACRMVKNRPSHALVDGNHLPAGMPCPATAIVRGDSRSKSIAAASIIAKVERDNIMRKLAREHPNYGWDRNAGYPTREHIHAINVFGITPHHRKSFGPVARFLDCGQTVCQTRFAV